jgi:hypothetical protein
MTAKFFRFCRFRFSVTNFSVIKNRRECLLIKLPKYLARIAS